MVQSRLEKSINYKEIKNINKETSEYFKEYYKINDAITYNIILFGILIEITFGKKTDEFKEKNVVYYPIYLLLNDVMSYQIGIIEFSSNTLVNNLDENGDIIFENLENTLFFSYANDFIEKEMTKVTAKITAKVTTKVKTATNVTTNVNPAKKVKTATKDNIDDEIEQLLLAQELESERELDDSVDVKSNPGGIEDLSQSKWIKAFMKDNKFTIQDTAGNGNCFFEAISRGLETVGKKISIEELRALLSGKATEEVFNTNKLLYENIISELSKINTQIENFTKNKNKLGSDLKKSRNRSDQKRIEENITETKENIANMDQIKTETLKYQSEYNFMKDINNLEQFKALILSRTFWAETWSISTLERILNVKFIVLSEYNYDIKDMGNVLQCGQLNDDIELFQPSHYIIVSYTGNHYKLVKYDGRGAFTFQQLSPLIKQLIVDKCIERDAGPYYIIPEFVQYKQSLIQEVNPELYNDDIVFRFYYKSDGKPYPGKGAGEKIPKDEISDFAELARIKDWRKKLSNLWDGNIIELDGKKWQSVEHYYQGSKFKKNNYEYYKQFSLDSGSELSKDATLAKSAGSKTGKHKTKQFRDPKIKMDPDFEKIKDKELIQAQTAKFNQHPELKNMLTKTGNARLVHYSRGSEPVDFNNLMRLRQLLRK